MADLSRHFRFGRFSISTTGFIIFALSVLYLLSLRYYHNTSYRDPTSFFFDATRAYERLYSSKRIADAEAFLRASDNVDPPTGTPDTPPTMCLGIVTVRRRGDQYVGLTVASLLEGLTESERKSVFLDLLIGNTDPTAHPIYSEKWAHTLPDRLLKYPPDHQDFEQIQKWEEGGWYRNKTIYDYTHLMRDCYDTGAAYIAMIEDDTLAVKGWLPSALQALSVVEQRTAGEDWLYLRLFYVDNLLGWNAEEWPRYVVWSFVVWACLTGTMLVARRNLKSVRSLPVSAVWIVSGVFVPAGVALHFLAGRQTMWPLSPGVHEMNKYGCCSQGLVFPRATVPRFLDQTDLTTDWLVDMMVEKIADREQWSRWAIVPPLLQHIGATSSKGYGFDDSAKTLWNFRFEEYPY